MEPILAALESFGSWGNRPLVLPWYAALIVGALGASAIWAKSQWATIVHELGHALTGVVLGMRVSDISLNQDSSGLTTSTYRIPTTVFGRVVSAPFRWLRNIAVSFAGYPAPFAYAALMMWAWSQNWSRFVLLATLSALIFTLLHASNWFGRSMLAFGIFVVGVTIFIEVPWAYEVVCLFVAGGLIGGGIRSLISLTLATVRHQAQDHSDAYDLSRLTFIPAVIWLALFYVASAFFAYLCALTFYTVFWGG